MSLIPKLDYLLEVALYVENLGHATEFYRSTLGLEVIDSDERIHALGVGGRQLLLLCKKGASVNPPRGSHDAEGRQHIAFAIPPSELPAWREWLGQRGVALEETRRWARGGVSLYFRDPDDHLIELATPGVWSVY